MSKESWLEEFYPVSAIDLIAETKDGIEITKHSLQKWKGATPENLNKHEIRVTGSSFWDKNAVNPMQHVITFNASTCSLCRAYYTKRGAISPCESCPLYRYLQRPCCNDTLTESENNEYTEFTLGGNPYPMIKALEGTLDMLEEEKENENHSSNS